MRPSVPAPTGHADRRAGVGDFLAANQTLGGIHRNGAHRRFAEMLGHFEHQAVARILGLDRVQNGGQMTLELNVNDGADDLRNASGLVGLCSHETLSFQFCLVVRRLDRA